MDVGVEEQLGKDYIVFCEHTMLSTWCNKRTCRAE